jgi:hypothetical protein
VGDRGQRPGGERSASCGVSTVGSRGRRRWRFVLGARSVGGGSGPIRSEGVDRWRTAEVCGLVSGVRPVRVFVGAVKPQDHSLN